MINLVKLLGLTMLGSLLVLPAFGDTFLFRDEASISGKVLAEKSGHVYVDVGYTVLSIPRDAIRKWQKELKAEEKQASAKGEAATAVLEKAGSDHFYYTGSFPEKTVRDLAARLGEAVVQVSTPGGLGSGFILNPEGYLITNFHVIERETQISVTIFRPQKNASMESENQEFDQKTFKDVRIVAVNKYADLALLKIENAANYKFHYVPIATSSEQISIGDRLFAIGSPMGLERTVTEGILSTKTRNFEGRIFLQTTAQINPGNSGGPLFNLRGEVVGVNNMKLIFAEGLGFAIPIEQLRFFLDHREAFAYSNENPSSGYRYLEPPRRNHSPQPSK